MPNSRLFSRDFGAHVVGEDEQLREVPLNKEEFYHGHVHGETKSAITHWDTQTHSLVYTHTHTHTHTHD